MARWYGSIGYGVENKVDGVVTKTIIEKQYYGTATKVGRKFRGEKINDDITTNTEISIVADPYALNNFQDIIYCVFMNQYWKVDNVDVQRPRLILSLGGKYDGVKASTSAQA